MPDADAAGGGHGVQRGRGGVVPGGGLAQHPGLRHLPSPPARRGEPARPAWHRDALPPPGHLSYRGRARRVFPALRGPPQPDPGGPPGCPSRTWGGFPPSVGHLSRVPGASAAPRVPARPRSRQSPGCGAAPCPSGVRLRRPRRVGLSGPRR